MCLKDALIKKGLRIVNMVHEPYSQVLMMLDLKEIQPIRRVLRWQALIGKLADIAM